jgi:hypothetical protein
MKDGFVNGCRHFIGINDFYFKGPYEWVLLAVVGLDAYKWLFPIAYAVVEGKNNIILIWLLYVFYGFIKTRISHKPFCIMSNIQKVWLTYIFVCLCNY